MKTSVTLLEPLKKIRQLAEDVLLEMSNTLLSHQCKGTSYRTWFGGVICPADAVLHGASNYAILPFAYQCAAGRGEAFNTAMLDNLRFIRGNQHKPGFWNNDNTTLWKGTSVFVLMGLCRAYQLVDKPGLISETVRDQWLDSIARAANWLAGDPGLASWNTNYVLSSGAALAISSEVLNQKKYASVASQYIDAGLARLNVDGYLAGEIVETDDTFEHAIDPGYDLEMSLPSLVMYSRLTRDSSAMQAAIKLLDSHLSLMMSDGSLDVGWGSRGYKWTYLGSLTAHGILMGLLPLLEKRPDLNRFVAAHLKLMQSFMKEGILGSGAHFWQQDDFLPCMIGTLAKSSGLALGLSYMPDKLEAVNRAEATTVAMQATQVLEVPGVVLVRTPGLEASVSAVNYRSDREIMRATIPTGGAICRLTDRKAGRIQLGSHGQYDRVEALNMQEVPNAGVSTPRIEWNDNDVVYSNIFDHDSKMTLNSEQGDLPASISVSGKMKNRYGLAGPLSYQVSYEISPSHISKRYEICGDTTGEQVRIIEPIVMEPGDTIRAVDDAIVILRGDYKIMIHFNGEGEILPILKMKSWVPIPGVWVRPVEIFLPGDINASSALVDIRICELSDSKEAETGKTPVYFENVT